MQPGGQTLAIQCPAFEMFFGGQAGPGKTFCLVVDALSIHLKTSIGKAGFEIPEYRAVLFRRETKDFQKLLDEAHGIYPALGGVYAAAKTGYPGPCFEFPSGAKIFLCHMAEEKDKTSHDGQEYHFVGFDELCQFTITQYLYLFARCRSKTPGVIPRIRGTGNPIGIGLWWVKKRFIDHRLPYAINWYVADEDPSKNPKGIEVDSKHLDGLSRCFIPGFLHENLVLMRNDPKYPSRIKAQGKRMERALLGGDWNAFAGDFFSEFDSSRGLVSPFVIPKDWFLIGSLDPGYSSPLSFGLTARSPDNVFYRIFTYYEAGRSASIHAPRVAEKIRSCRWTMGRHPDVIVAGHDAFAKKNKFDIIASDVTMADVFEAHGMALERAHLDRHNGWWLWRRLMSSGRYRVFRGLNDSLLDEIISAPADEKDPEDIQGRGNDIAVMDHALDEQRYGLVAGFAPSSVKQHTKDWFSRLRRVAEDGSTPEWKFGMG